VSLLYGEAEVYGQLDNMEVSWGQFSTPDSPSPSLSFHSCMSNLSNDTSLEHSNSTRDKFISVFDSLRLFFGSLSLKAKSSCSKQTRVQCAGRRMSSGYHSFETSWEIDESYIKISKFSESVEAGECGHYGTYKEYKEMAQQQCLASEIKELVEIDTSLNIKISDYLTLRTAGDVMNLSKCEPYGLKGCKLIVIVQDVEDIRGLGNIYPEKGLISTFEITLVLHLKTNPCRKLPFLRCQPNERHVLEQYELRKEKMYKTTLKRHSSLPRMRGGKIVEIKNT